MLRLLIVALPPIVALPAAFDEQEANAIQFEVKSPLRFEVRSPPESRLLLPAAPREINTTAPPHTPLRTHNTHTHTSPCSSALKRGQDNPPRDQLRHQPLRAQGHQPTNRRCAPRPGRQPHMQRAQLSVGPTAARACFRRCTTLYVHTRARAPAPTTCPPRRAGLRATHNLRSPSARANAPPRLFCSRLAVAPPVQAAAAASGRARRPPHPRHLRHVRQARRRLHGHDDQTTVTSALSRSAQAARGL